MRVIDVLAPARCVEPRPAGNEVGAPLLDGLQYLCPERIDVPDPSVAEPSGCENRRLHPVSRPSARPWPGAEPVGSAPPGANQTMVLRTSCAFTVRSAGSCFYLCGPSLRRSSAATVMGWMVAELRDRHAGDSISSRRSEGKLDYPGQGAHPVDSDSSQDRRPAPGPQPAKSDSLTSWVHTGCSDAGPERAATSTPCSEDAVRDHEIRRPALPRSLRRQGAAETACCRSVHSPAVNGRTASTVPVGNRRSLTPDDVHHVQGPVASSRILTAPLRVEHG